MAANVTYLVVAGGGGGGGASGAYGAGGGAGGYGTTPSKPHNSPVSFCNLGTGGGGAGTSNNGCAGKNSNSPTFPTIVGIPLSEINPSTLQPPVSILMKCV